MPMEGKEEEEEDEPIKTQDPKEEEEEEEVDRISLSPDGLIIDEILSRLDSTKEAIKTGTLSKRWQHLWPSVPCLFFSDDSFRKFSPSDCISYGRPVPDFYMCVDKTLTQCQLHNLYKFTLCTNYDMRFESQVTNWIRFATSKLVQQLHLDFSCRNKDHFVLKDDSFFINSHFTHLHLVGCKLNPNGPICWKNLTHLTISYGKLDHDLIANILSGSPLLDTLRLDYCYGYSLLDITSESVKNLVFDGFDDEFGSFDSLGRIIEINAPYISSLSILGCLWLSKILLRNVSSLVKAELDYTKFGHDRTKRKEEREEMLKRLILSLHHVKVLQIGSDCYTAYFALEAKGFIFPPNELVEFNYPSYDSTELSDCSDNDSSVGGSSRADLQSTAAIFPPNELVEFNHPSYDSTELSDCSDNDSSVGGSSRADLQSTAATLGQVQATQRIQSPWVRESKTETGESRQANLANPKGPIRRFLLVQIASMEGWVRKKLRWRIKRREKK